MKHLALLLVIATTAIVAGASSAAAAAPNDPVRIEFTKSSSSTAGVWNGFVSGDVSGGLTTRLTELRISGPIWHVRFDWIINAGSRSFVADLTGTLNNDTGQVVMNGTVVQGWLVGAEVHEMGHLTDLDTLSFAGEIRIMPATV